METTRDNPRLASAFVLVVLVLLQLGSAQGYGTRSQPLLAQGEFHIVNRAHTEIRFRLRAYGVADWARFSLGAGEGRTYTCRCTDIEIYVGTVGQDPVRYRLRHAERYLIQWNADRQLWDVYLVRD